MNYISQEFKAALLEVVSAARLELLNQSHTHLGVFDEPTENPTDENK